MKRLVLLLGILLLAGCKPHVKDVFLHVRPTSGEVMAGNTIDMFATTYPVIQTATYKWSVNAKCKVSITGKGPKITLHPDKFCVQQSATVSVAVTANGKSAKKSKTFSILEATGLPPRLKLDPPKTGWLMINDYADKSRLKLNNLKASVSTWSTNGGICRTDIQKGMLKIDYNLPSGNSMCGTMNHLADKEGKAVPFDISKYGRLSIKLRSGDGKRHKIKVIIVEYDPYQVANQGLVGKSQPLIALKDRWWRYELPLKYTLPELFDRSRAKGVGLRIKGEKGDKGIIMVDDLGFIPKEKK